MSQLAMCHALPAAAGAVAGCSSSSRLSAVGLGRRNTTSPPTPQLHPTRRRARALALRASASASSASSDADKALCEKASAASDILKAVTITLVGDHEAANYAVAHALAKALGYTPLSTPELIEKAGRPYSCPLVHVSAQPETPILWILVTETITQLLPTKVLRLS